MRRNILSKRRRQGVKKRSLISALSFNFNSLKRTYSLANNPQKSGVCENVIIVTPRKPNSALRKVAIVRLSNGLRIKAYIPGEGHTLKRSSTVLIKKGGAKDIGVKYEVIIGKYDAQKIAKEKEVKKKR